MKGPDRKEQSAPMKPGKDEKIILASGSPRRRAMMEYFGVPFEVIPSELSEFFAEGEGQWRALDMARKKAFMLSRKVSPAATFSPRIRWCTWANTTWASPRTATTPCA